MKGFKSSDGKKTVKSGMLINCDPAEKEQFVLAARRSGASLTEWVLKACRGKLVSANESKTYSIDKHTKERKGDPFPQITFEIVDNEGTVYGVTNNADEALDIQYALNNNAPELPGGGFSEETLAQAREHRLKQHAEEHKKSEAAKQSQHVVTPYVPQEGEVDLSEFKK